MCSSDLEKEEQVIEATKEEIKAAIAEADKVPKQKVSDFLKNMFEVFPDRKSVV